MARIALITLLTCLSLQAALAQTADAPVDEDGSSEQTEQSDDAFRRSRELEDARARDQTYIDTDYGQQRDLEKIDKLPEESRDNIRNQLIDVIVETGEWEPADALEDYPYTPSEAAQADPDLKKLEQEAWEEQIEKYHEREAAAWGAHRGPVPGPGNPTGQEGGQTGESGDPGQQGGQQGSGGAGANPGQDGSGDGTAGTYQPYSSNRDGGEDGTSTAGVSESALDFLKGRQAANPADSQPQPPAVPDQAPGEASQAGAESADSIPQDEPQAAATPEQRVAAQSAAAEMTETAAAPSELDLDTRGIIAIKDLEKLEGAEISGGEEDDDQQEN